MLLPTPFYDLTAVQFIINHTTSYFVKANNNIHVYTIDLSL